MPEFLIVFEHATSGDTRLVVEADDHDDAFQQLFEGQQWHPNEIWSEVQVTRLGDTKVYDEDEVEGALIDPDFWDQF